MNLNMELCRFHSIFYCYPDFNPNPNPSVFPLFLVFDQNALHFYIFRISKVFYMHLLFFSKIIITLNLIMSKWLNSLQLF